MDIRAAGDTGSIYRINPVSRVGKVRRREHSNTELFLNKGLITLKEGGVLSRTVNYSFDDKDSVNAYANVNLLKLRDKEEIVLEVANSSDIHILREIPGPGLYTPRTEDVTNSKTIVLAKKSKITIMFKDMVFFEMVNIGRNKKGDAQEFVVVEYQDV